MEWIKGKKKSFSIINYVNNKFSIKKTKKWRNKTLYRKKEKEKKEMMFKAYSRRLLLIFKEFDNRN